MKPLKYSSQYVVEGILNENGNVSLGGFSVESVYDWWVNPSIPLKFRHTSILTSGPQKVLELTRSLISDLHALGQVEALGGEHFLSMKRIYHGQPKIPSPSATLCCVNHYEAWKRNNNLSVKPKQRRNMHYS